MSAFNTILNERTLVLLLAAAAWLAQRIGRQLKGGEERKRAATPSRTPEGKKVDPEAEARRRRVQREVARKIAERRWKLPQPPTARVEDPPLSRPPPLTQGTPPDLLPQRRKEKMDSTLPRSERDSRGQPPAAPLPAWGSDPADTRRAAAWDTDRVEDQFDDEAAEEADVADYGEARMATARNPRGIGGTRAAAAPAATTAPLVAPVRVLDERPAAERETASSPWIDLLRDPDSARRAVVLREILGPPAALRRIPAL